MQNLSTIERQWKGHEASKSLFPSLLAIGRQHPESDTDARHVDQAARAIPDQMFAGHPDVVRLTADLTARQHRAEGLAMRKTQPSVIADAMARMQQELDAGAEAFRLAALDDALNGDLEFPRALATKQEMEALELKLRAARLAYADLSRSPPEQGEFQEQARRARTALQNALFRLKREHVQTRSDLLSVGSSGA